jgi:hypothetical protein
MISELSNSAFALDDVKDSLFQSLENLYNVFSTYLLKPVVEGCPHCIGKKMGSHLHRAPLRELTVDDLESFAYKAMTTWGDSVDYRHFLPRIVELSLTADEAVHGFTPWVIGSKLAYADWIEWPAQETASLVQFMESAWRSVISYPPEEVSTACNSPIWWVVEDVLSFQANALQDISTLLEIWGSANEIEPKLHLSIFAYYGAPYFAKKRKLMPFVTVKSPLALEQLGTWLMKPSLLSTLMETFEKDLEEPWASTLAAGIDALEWIQQVGVDR